RRRGLPRRDDAERAPAPQAHLLRGRRGQRLGVHRVCERRAHRAQRLRDPGRHVMIDDSKLDGALDFLAGFGPDLSNGMTSHAPMVVETLASLGRGDASEPWLAGYRSLLLPRPVARERIA